MSPTIPKSELGMVGIDPLFLNALSELRNGSETIMVGDTGEAIPHLAAGKPSVAVLPFDNMSGDPDQAFFSDGITEDIITELSRFRSLFVIARNSSFSFRGQAINISDIGSKLGVEYIVEGSVRKVGSRVRITAQLIEVASGNHAWAERYDRSLDDIFVVQDEVARVVASTISSQVGKDISSRAARKHPDNFLAYEYLLRGSQHHQRFTTSDNMEAMKLIEHAIKLDPQYAEAYAWFALTHIANWSSTLAEADLKTALSLAKQATDLDGLSAICQIVLGYAYLLSKQFEKAEHHHKLAVTLNPNDPHAAVHMGYFLALTGKAPDSGIWFDRGFHFNPYPPDWYHTFRCAAAFVDRRYGDVLPIGSFGSNVSEVMYAVSALGHMGKKAEAANWLSKCRTLQPNIPVVDFAKAEPFSLQADLDHLLEGLRNAGALD